MSFINSQWYNTKSSEWLVVCQLAEKNTSFSWMVSHQPHVSSLLNDDIEKYQLAGQTKYHRLDVYIPAEKYIILYVAQHCKHI